MHTVVVDITIQGDSAKASASHFHTVVPFHDLLTIWFSYGQSLWNSAFRILVYSIRFPCLCIHRLSLFGRETRPFLFSKNSLFWGRQSPAPPLYFEKTEKTNAVPMGLEPTTSCVVDDARFELAREVLNIHLTLKVHRLSIIRQSSNDFWNGLLHYTGRHSNQLNYGTSLFK